MMQAQEQIESEAGALRQAVIHEDFSGAQVAARRYAQALELELKALPPDRAKARLRTALELLEWARRSMCVARGRMAVQLRNVRRMALYRPAARPIPSRFRFDA